MAIDPELLAFIEEFPPLELSIETVRDIRDEFNEMSRSQALNSTEFQHIRTDDHNITESESGQPVRVRIYRQGKTDMPQPALLWIHGGGYVLGCLEMDELILCRMVHDTGLTIISVDYRLAPEHPYPAALDDCFSALGWIFDNSDQLNIDPNRVGIGGASAGAGLAAALTLRNRGSENLNLVYQCLVYPMLDHRSHISGRGGYEDRKIWTRENNQFAWRAYLNCDNESQETSLYASPARAHELRDLPPAYISVGDQYLFFDEDLDYARRLVHSDVAVELHVIPGAIHGFDMFPVRITEEEIERRHRALARNL